MVGVSSLCAEVCLDEVAPSPQGFSDQRGIMGMEMRSDWCVEGPSGGGVI